MFLLYIQVGRHQQRTNVQKVFIYKHEIEHVFDFDFLLHLFIQANILPTFQNREVIKFKYVMVTFLLMHLLSVVGRYLGSVICLYIKYVIILLIVCLTFVIN